jgi:hypothetical protein
LSKGSLLLLALSSCIFTPSSPAEWLRFKAGGDLQLPAQIDGDSVILAAPGKTYTFSRADFSRILPGHWPDREWPDRLASARPRGAQAVYEASWWALENGLTPEALAALDEAHRLDPSLIPLGRLHDLTALLSKPLPDPDLPRLRSALAGDFQETRTDHIILLHQHDPAEAAELAEALERVFATFYLSFTAQGLDLSLPPTRAVLVWYATDPPFHAQLRRESGREMPSTRGYYSPSRGIVLLGDTRATADHRRAEAANQRRLDELTRTTASLANVPPRARFRLEVGGEPARTVNRAEADRILARLCREVDRQALLLDLRRRAVDLGTAAHELVHLLVASSGLLPRGGSAPLWLQEGLATQFEVVRGGRWAGLGRLHDLRLADYRRISPPPPLAPLLRDAGLGQGYSADPYASAWSWVYFLRKQHPQVFLSFLDLQRSPSPPPTFPSLPPLEPDWHRFLASLRLPLDDPEIDSPSNTR